MHLRFLTLSLAIAISSNYALGMDIEDGNRGEAASSHMKEAINTGYLDNSDSTSVSEDECTSKKGTTSTLKLDEISIPKMNSAGKNKPLKLTEDSLEIQITLANGESYIFGTKGGEIKISDFKPLGNRSARRFDVRITDKTPYLISRDKGIQNLKRCKFQTSSEETELTVVITYNKGAKRFFAHGFWPQATD